MRLTAFRALGIFVCVTTGVASAGVAPEVQRKLASVSAPFVPNAGQWNDEVAFGAPTFAGTLFVAKSGRIAIRSLTQTLVDRAGRPLALAPRGAGERTGKVSYAIGADESRHRDELPTFERVDLGDIQPGISVQLRAAGRNVEKIFTVGAGRDPDAIRVEVGGVERLEVGQAGELIAHTLNGAIVYTAPVAYQEDATGKRSGVAVRYALDTSAKRYGFALGAYDTTRPLVIDPLLQSTYLGGNALDTVTAMAVHPVTGEIYVAGYSISTDFPAMLGSEQGNHAADASRRDAFVSRLNATLTQILQSTYIGGDDNDEALAIAIDPGTGDVYVAGYTSSTNFPKTAGGAWPAKNLGEDGFVTRLNAALTTRIQSTHLGGTGNNDRVRAIAIHPATGDVYVAGSTDSAIFPMIAGSEQPMKGFGFDAFVARLNAALTTHHQSTFIGGNASDLAHALAIHPFNEDVYVAGVTTSTDFPETAGGAQTAHGNIDGQTDAFVTRLNVALTNRLQSTYLGGNGGEQALSMAIHPANGEIYVAGYTSSAVLPKVAGAEQIVRAGTNDAFVARIDPSLTAFLQSTYVGGGATEQANALAIHPATGEVYIAGVTLSADFPKVAGAEQPTRNGPQDGFVTRLNSALTTRIQSTYLGAGSSDAILAMAIHPVSGEVYVAGSVVAASIGSDDFPKVAGSGQPNHGADGAGGVDGFASRYSIDLLGTDAVPDPFAFAPKLNVPVGSRQASAPARITGVTGSVPISIAGNNFADYCISSGNNCNCDVQPMGHASLTIANLQYVCVRLSAPFSYPGIAKATLVAGGGWANFLVTTGNETGGPGTPICSLDVDGNLSVDALTDGLLLIRAMFGLTGTSVTTGAIGSGAARSTWAQIQPYLNGNCGTTFAP